jgi:hypothetical protein
MTQTTNEEREMDNKVLSDIAEYAKKRLMESYGFCGVMENPEMVMLNSDDGDGNDIKIVIKTGSEL